MKPALLQSVLFASLALAGAVPVQAADGTKPITQIRPEISSEFRWDFSPIYANWAAWENGMKEIDQKIEAFGKRKGTLKRGPVAILQA